MLLLAADRIAALLVARVLYLLAPKTALHLNWLTEPPFRRWASRTTILRRALSEIFASAKLTDLRSDRPKLVIVACELRNKSAFYFAADGVGSWHLGTTAASSVEIAQAVAASTAYPALLPALDQSMSFVKANAPATTRVILTDGGVYDNLGLAPLWPDRQPEISLHTAAHDRIIACRAGYGVAKGPLSVFWASRMVEVLLTSLARTENLSINRLFDLLKAGRLKGVLVPYLGQSNSKLASPPPT